MADGAMKLYGMKPQMVSISDRLIKTSQVTSGSIARTMIQLQLLIDGRANVVRKDFSFSRKMIYTKTNGRRPSVTQDVNYIF